MVHIPNSKRRRSEAAWLRTIAVEIVGGIGALKTEEEVLTILHGFREAYPDLIPVAIGSGGAPGEMVHYDEVHWDRPVRKDDRAFFGLGRKRIDPRTREEEFQLEYQVVLLKDGRFTRVRPKQIRQNNSKPMDRGPDNGNSPKSRSK